MASALDLAAALRALDGDTLATRLAGRTLARASSIHDAFDLADALIESTSVKDALAHLDRGALATAQAARAPITRAALVARLEPTFVASQFATASAAGEVVDKTVDLLVERFLMVESEGTVTTVAGVAERLDDDPALSYEALIEARHVDGAVGDRPADARPTGDRASVDARAAERLFSVVIEVAEVIRAVEASPARELAKGGLALPETKRLAEAAHVDAEAVAALVDLGARAGLIDLTGDGWAPTSDAPLWLASDWAARWAELAEAWSNDLTADLRALLERGLESSWGLRLEEFGRWFYPAGGDWITERLAAVTRTAETLGLAFDSAPSTVAVVLLRDGIAEARAAVAAVLPEAIEQVYLQHDLSVVAPGPLSAAVDTRLRVLADVESAGLAATYRIAEPGVRRALDSGETEQSLRAFLQQISLTGIPQPLDYLLTETAARHGRYRVASFDPARAGSTSSSSSVRSDPSAASSQVRSDDPALVDTLEVDQALSSLALRRLDPWRMVSRFDVETVYWALDDQRYPVVLEDQDAQALRSPRRRRLRRAPSAPARDPIAEIVERLRLPEGEEPEETERAWIARQLDAAVKARMTVALTVARPDGSTMQLSLEPTGVGGGRVRGRDRKSDIERTLPLSSVVAVSADVSPSA